MKLNIEINLDNDAFSNNINEEVTRILLRFIKNIELSKLENGYLINLRDINGNTVGYAKIGE